MLPRTILLGAAVAVLAVTACGEDEGNAPETKITTVDELLARTCELAADCVSAPQDEIEACPGHLRQELDADDLAELGRFTTLDKSEQDRILECFDASICGRFGGSLLFMSDSDLMEPLRNCE
jgi:hypothetical protein